MHISRALFSSVKRFATTGLTGLNPVENPKPLLIETYNKTLQVLQRMPQHAVYRQATEALTQHRLKVVEAATERPATEQAAAGALPEVETQLEDGLVEEILETAQAELVLAERMLLWKPWEALEEAVPEGQWVRHERK